MRQYSSDYRPGMHDTSELDPCIAAETRMKKSVMSDKMRRILILLGVFLCFLFVVALLILVLLYGGNDSPQLKLKNVDYDELDHPDGSGAIYGRKDSDIYGPNDNKDEILPTLLYDKQLPQDVATDETTTVHQPTPWIWTTASSRPLPVIVTLPTSTQQPMLDSNTPATFQPAPITPSDEQPTVSVRVFSSSSSSSSGERGKYATVSEENKTGCMEHLADGYGTGIYYLSPSRTDRFLAVCEQDTNGGGWTIFQRRISALVYFYNRTWEEYEAGFGRLDDSYWLGLSNIHALAPEDGSWWTLRIELRGDLCANSTKCGGKPDGFWWGEWDFKLGDADSNYTLYLRSSGNGPLNNAHEKGEQDSLMQLNNGRPFTAYGRDNDRSPQLNCAQFRNMGGWWHHDCSHVALNGLYGDTQPKERYMVYSQQELTPNGARKGYFIHPRESIMMIRPKN